MIFTDGYRVMSDKPEGQYKELFDFAKKMEIRPGDLHFHKNVPYFPLLRRGQRGHVKRKRHKYPLISRPKFDDFLRKQEIIAPHYMWINFHEYTRASFLSARLNDIVNIIKNPLIRHKKTRIKTLCHANKRGAEAVWYDRCGATISLTVTKENLGGYYKLEHEGKVVEEGNAPEPVRTKLEQRMNYTYQMTFKIK